MNDTDQLEGLSSEDARRRLGLFGHNTLPNTERRSVPRIVVGIVRQPMFALLLGGGVIYALLGEALDAAVLTLFATLSVSISILQDLGALIDTEQVDGLDSEADERYLLLSQPEVLVVFDLIDTQAYRLASSVADSYIVQFVRRLYTMCGATWPLD